MRTYLSYFTLCTGSALLLSGTSALLAVREPWSLIAVLLWVTAIGTLLWAAWWQDHLTQAWQPSTKESR